MALPRTDLHNFSGQERRQYRRVDLQFAVWWLKTAKADGAVTGIGVEISGGGLQFLLQDHIPQRECSIAFQIEDRRMRARIITILAAEVEFRQERWQHHRAKFLGLLETDFDFIITLTERGPAAGADATQSSNLIGDLQSYDMFPASVREKIVRTLVAMKRLAAPRSVELALLSAHYVGLQRADQGNDSFHRLSIRSKMNSEKGALVFDSLFFISQDGSKVFARE